MASAAAMVFMVAVSSKDVHDLGRKGSGKLLLPH